MRIRILHVTDVRLTLQPGDELLVADGRPDAQRLVDSRRIDGAAVCEVVVNDEAGDEAHDPRALDERAVVRTTSRPRSRGVTGG